MHACIHAYMHTYIHTYIHTYNTHTESYTYKYIHSGYFYLSSSSPLLLRDAPDEGIDTVSKLTHRNATGMQLRAKDLPYRSLRGG